MKKIMSLAAFSILLLVGCKDGNNEFNGGWKLISGESNSPYLLEINCDKTCHLTSRTINHGVWSVDESEWVRSDDTISNSGISLTLKDGELSNGKAIYQKIVTNSISSMMKEKEQLDDKQRANDFMRKLDGN